MVRYVGKYPDRIFLRGRRVDSTIAEWVKSCRSHFSARSCVGELLPGIQDRHIQSLAPPNVVLPLKPGATVFTG